MMVDWMLRLAAHSAFPGGKRGRLPILFFHRVLQQPDPMLPDELDAASFDAQMRALAAAFTVLPMDEAVPRLAEGRLPARAVCITFDDGYRDNADVAAPILRRHGLSATFYIASDFLDGGLMFNDQVVEAVRRMPAGTLALGWLGLDDAGIGDTPSRIATCRAILAAIKYLPAEARAEACARLVSLAQAPMPQDVMMSSAQLRGLQKSGMCIGGHTLGHPILTRIPDDEAWRQIDGNKRYLDGVLDRPVRHFAYPNGKPDRDYGVGHVEMVRRAGYQTAVTTASGVCAPQDDPCQLPRLSLWHRNPHRARISLIRAGLSGTRARVAAGPGGQPVDAEPSARR